jgi:hypothetical protein
MSLCCKWLQYMFKPHTVHMAADIKVGSVLFLGVAHLEFTVTSISQTFDEAAASVLIVTANNSGNGDATLTFRKSANGKDVLVEMAQTFQLWGLKDHKRNKHSPSAARDLPPSESRSEPLLLL